MMRRCLETGVILAALFAAGCGVSPRVVFYTLAPAERVESGVTGKGAPSVVVGPVTLPETVDRPQLVVRSSANRVEILESHRWAEPLKSEIPLLVARDLGRLLGSDRVSSYRQYAGEEAQYRVLLDITRFESGPGDTVGVEAVWTLRRAAGGVAKTGRTRVSEKVEGAGYDALVAAYGRALVTVSRDIAGAIQAEGAPAH